MHLKGIGIDIFEKKRMRAALARKNSGVFLKRIFRSTKAEKFKRPAGECLYCSTAFALKEAVLKALGTGWNSPSNFRDVHVILKGRKAEIELSGKTKAFAGKKGIKKEMSLLSYSPSLYQLQFHPKSNARAHFASWLAIQKPCRSPFQVVLS